MDLAGERPPRARPWSGGSPGTIPNPAVKPRIAESTAGEARGRIGRRARGGRFFFFRARGRPQGRPLFAFAGTRCRGSALLATCPSRLTYHLAGHYGHRVRAAFLYPRLYAWQWRIFFVAKDLALPVNERLEWTVVSGGAAAPGMLLRALWTTYLSRSKPPNTPEVRSKGVLSCLAGRFSPARFGSYPSDNMPFEAK